MISLLQVSEKVCRPLKRHSNSFDGHIHIGECGSTLYVGLTGIVRNKSLRDGHAPLSIFSLGRSRASDNTKAAMEEIG